MTDVVLCLISQSESYSPAQYRVLYRRLPGRPGKLRSVRASLPTPAARPGSMAPRSRCARAFSGGMMNACVDKYTGHQVGW